MSIKLAFSTHRYQVYQDLVQMSAIMWLSVWQLLAHEVEHLDSLL